MSGLGRAFHFASAESSALPSTRRVSRRALIVLTVATFIAMLAVGYIAQHTQGAPEVPMVVVSCPAPAEDEGLQIIVTARKGGGHVHRCSYAAGRAALRSTRIDNGGK